MDMTIPGGHRNPFKVPEEYFNALPQRVMQRISQEEEAHKMLLAKRRRNLFLVRIGMAAAFTGVFALAGMLVFQRKVAIGSSADSFAQVMELDDYNDEALEYAMLDNNDIEYYLTVAE